MLASARAMGTIAVADLGRAKRFYEGTLGLKRSAIPEVTLYEMGAGTSFLVYESQFAGTCKSTSITLAVDDFDGAVKDMRGRGVAFEDYDLPEVKTVNGIAGDRGTRVAWFKDPDGNVLSLVEIPA
jgi:catechol 2,3-dioxygenase-like lactoylglutathione lyase family enzyme